MKKGISIVLCLLLVVALTSCGIHSDTEENMELGAIRGRYCEAANGTSLLLSETQGAICISPADSADLLTDLENGDEIEIMTDGVAETYPAQATVYSYTLIEKGTVENLDPEELQSLENLGWEFSFQ
jgi:hypothetical protein